MFLFLVNELNQAKRILVNGKFVDQIPVKDRGLAYGDGVFETIRIFESKMPFWPEHVARLLIGLRRLSIVFPENLEQLLLSDIKILISNNSVLCSHSAIIKIVVTRGSGGRGYSPKNCNKPLRICLLSENPYELMNKDSSFSSFNFYPDKFKLIICTHPISTNAKLAGIKHLNRLDQVLASNELLEQDDEGLLVDHSGSIVEGTKSNVVVQSQGEWHTPKLTDSGVQGVMLNAFKKFIVSTGETWQEVHLSRKAFTEVDHIYIMNSVLGIRHVSEFQGRHFQIPADYYQIRKWLSEAYGYPAYGY